MNFKIKVLLQRVFSAVPRGELLNYVFQRYVSKSLPPGETEFMNKVNRAVTHHKNFTEYNRLVSRTHQYYEFGAGSALSIPIAMSQLGFKVFCIDIRKLVIPVLIRDSLKKYELYRKKISFPFKKIDEQAFSKGDILEYLEREFDINYLAPFDARKTGFESNSFDFMSSSVVLEHIPKDDILAILKECYRILNKGGVLSLTVDYQDHYSYFDKSISIYNFLQYSAKEWKKYNPALHYQNRLRHSDYLELIRQSGFELVKVNPTLPTSEEKQQLAGLTLSNDFAGKSIEDIGLKWSEFVLVK